MVSQKEKSVLVSYAVTVLVTVVLSMTGFWLMIGRDFVTRAEARQIATEKVQVVEEKLEIYRQETKETRSVISKNSEVITDLKIELARLTEAISFLGERND